MNGNPFRTRGGASFSPWNWGAVLAVLIVLVFTCVLIRDAVRAKAARDAQAEAVRHAQEMLDQSMKPLLKMAEQMGRIVPRPPEKKR